MSEINRRDFVKISSQAALMVGLHSAYAEAETTSENKDTLQTPLPWLNEVYHQACGKNVLAALNPKVFFGYFCVCADGQGFGYANTYPSLDGHQLSHALLFLGKLEEVLANWEYVKNSQKPNGLLPIRIDSNGEGLFVHWVPGDPLRALGATTYAHNAYAIYTHTLDKTWLEQNIASINLSASYLASLVTPQGRIGGAGYYVECPTRIESDGVTQAYAVDAFQKTADLNRCVNNEAESTRWTELAARIRTNFLKEFWRDDHCVEYIHPERGPIDRHGLTDVDWAALAMKLLPADAAERLWQRLKDNPKFRYGGMPTGISTAPETYEPWETLSAEKFPNHDLFHDRAAMGRVWYVESWARRHRNDTEGLLSSLKAVAAAGAVNGYSWQERYFPSDQGLKPGGPMTYCEYPANLIRIVNQFLLGVEPHPDGTIHIAPIVPKEWWSEGWNATVHIGKGTLTLQGQAGQLSGTWSDQVIRKLVFTPPPGTTWQKSGEATVTPNLPATVEGVVSESPLKFRLAFGVM